MEFAHQFDQQPAPAFEECLEDFRNGTMQKYVELEHLKGEVDRLECEVRHYQRVLSAHPSDDLEEQYHPAFQKAPPSEISRLESKVNAARHEVDVKKQEVHERKMQNNYNPDTTTARRLAEAEKDLANAKSELKKAEYKLNEARRP